MSADIVKQLQSDIAMGPRLHSKNCVLVAANVLEEAAAEIVRLRGEVERALAYLGPHLNAGTFAAPDWAIQLASILTGGDGCGTPIAPAEAKGDACNCPGGSKRDPEKHAPNCPVRTLPCRTLVNPFDAPQPAGGEAVAFDEWYATYDGLGGPGNIEQLSRDAWSAANTNPQQDAARDPSHAWPAVDRILIDAYNAGVDGLQFDLMDGRKKIAALTTNPAGDALGAVRELADQLRGELLHASPMLEATMYEKGRTSEKQRCIAMLDAIAPQTEAALRPSAGEGKENG